MNRIQNTKLFLIIKIEEYKYKSIRWSKVQMGRKTRVTKRERERERERERKNRIKTYLNRISFFSVHIFAEHSFKEKCKRQAIELGNAQRKDEIERNKARVKNNTWERIMKLIYRYALLRF